MAVAVMAAAPQAHAAGIGDGTVTPQIVRCSTTYTNTSALSRWSSGRADIWQIDAWVLVKHDNSDGSVCTVQAKAKWYAGNSG
jgi:hypothetical protein